MLFINALLFIKAGSPRPSAAQQGGGWPAVHLLRERCIHRAGLCTTSPGVQRRGRGRVWGRQGWEGGDEDSLVKGCGGMWRAGGEPRGGGLSIRAALGFRRAQRWLGKCEPSLPNFVDHGRVTVSGPGLAAPPAEKVCAGPCGCTLVCLGGSHLSRAGQQ